MRSKIYIRICTMFYQLCVYAQQLSRQKAITFYMFHIFYTMGNVLRAIVYDLKQINFALLLKINSVLR